jgi:hypothetical protein
LTHVLRVIITDKLKSYGAAKREIRHYASTHRCISAALGVVMPLQAKWSC